MRPFVKRLVIAAGMVGIIAGIQLFLGGHMGQLIFPAQFFGLLGLALLCLVKDFGLKATTAFLMGRSTDSNQRRSFYGALRSGIWDSSLTLFILGMIHVMSLLNEPSEIGLGVAHAFLTVFYAGLISAILPHDVELTAVAKESRNRSLQLVGGIAAMFLIIMLVISMSDLNKLKTPRHEKSNKTRDVTQKEIQIDKG